MGVPKLFKYLTDRYPSLCQTIPASQVGFYQFVSANFLNMDCSILSIYFFCLSAAKVWLLVHRFEFFDSQSDHRQRPVAIGRGGFRILFGATHFRTYFTLHRNFAPDYSFESVVLVNRWRCTTCKMGHATWTTVLYICWSYKFPWFFFFIGLFGFTNRLHAIEKTSGTPVPFDSVSISPGTTFMLNLEAVLVEFVSKKIKSQKNWKNCEVFISGSNVRNFLNWFFSVDLPINDIFFSALAKVRSKSSTLFAHWNSPKATSQLKHTAFIAVTMIILCLEWQRVNWTSRSYKRYFRYGINISEQCNYSVFF